MAEIKLHQNTDGAALYQSLQNEVLALLPAAVVTHIGSTALSIPTKGDLDICVQVPQIDFAAARTVLDKHYPHNEGSYASDTLQSYAFARDGIDVGIQLVAQASADDHFVRFIDILKQQPDLRAEYVRIKQANAHKPASEYRAAKAEFIEKILNNMSS